MRVHERALRAGARVEQALWAEPKQDRPSSRARQIIEELQAAGCVVHHVPPEVIEQLTSGRSVAGPVGLVRMPRMRTLDDTISDRQQDGATILVAVDVEDPGNVGALARTALASGATALVAIGISDPLHPKAVRTSMGSVFKLPLLRYESAEQFSADCRQAEILRYGAVAVGGDPLPQVQRAQRSVALFMGGEARGLSPAVRTGMDRLITVPMSTAVDSFSVNAAAAVLLYELRRRL